MISYIFTLQQNHYYHRSLKRFVKDLEHVYDKMLTLTYTERSGLSFKNLYCLQDMKLMLMNKN